ncbi:MAG: histidine phosphatase family protein [Candidatus Melainabacteria bacterium]|nr:histidine phosphatase family protein [Candidatus Melainabacteria bacterium]
MSVKIIGVRHGDTIRTEKGETIQGGGLNDKEAQLSEKGIKAAEQLGANLAERYEAEILAQNIVIVSSTNDRCLYTAEIIAGAFQKKLSKLLGERTWIIDIYSDLEEIHHGKFEGMSAKLRNTLCTAWYDQQEAKDKEMGTVPEQNWRWKVNPLSLGIIPSDQIPYPSDLKPETIQNVCNRGIRVLHEIGKKFQGMTVIAVSSGAILWSIATLLKAREDNDTTAFPVYYGGKAGPLYPKPCSIIHFEGDANGNLFFRGKDDLADVKQKV